VVFTVKHGIVRELALLRQPFYLLRAIKIQ